MKLTTGLRGVIATVLLTFSVQTGAIANPFGGLTDAIEDINDTVETVEAVNNTFETITNLSETLGLSEDLDLTIGESDPVGQVMELYGLWFADMPASEQAIAAQLITGLANNEIASLDALSGSDWFSQQPASEQSQVTDTVSKLQGLLAATDEDTARFLGYASCISGSASGCSI